MNTTVGASSSISFECGPWDSKIKGLPDYKVAFDQNLKSFFLGFVFRPVGALDLDRAAGLHRQAFEPLGERPWTRRDR